MKVNINSMKMFPCEKKMVEIDARNKSNITKDGLVAKILLNFQILLNIFYYVKSHREISQNNGSTRNIQIEYC